MEMRKTFSSCSIIIHFSSIISIYNFINFYTTNIHFPFANISFCFQFYFKSYFKSLEEWSVKKKKNVNFLFLAYSSTRYQTVQISWKYRCGGKFKKIWIHLYILISFFLLISLYLNRFLIVENQFFVYSHFRIRRNDNILTVPFVFLDKRISI